MALLINEDGQREAGALHPAGREPELVPNREEASEHLEAVAAARLLEDSDLVQVGGDRGRPPASAAAAGPTWDIVSLSDSRVGDHSPMLVLRSRALCSG